MCTAAAPRSPAQLSDGPTAQDASHVSAGLLDIEGSMRRQHDVEAGHVSPEQGEAYL